MPYYGYVIHDSLCDSINGKGYDYLLTKDGQIIQAETSHDNEFIHLCLEGDFRQPLENPLPAHVKEQFFLLQKLVLYLNKRHSIGPNKIFSHQGTCPGHYFPWNQLVISTEDGYH